VAKIESVIGWNEDAVGQIQSLLNNLDVTRIDHNLTWAKHFIEKIEESGAVFKNITKKNDGMAGESSLTMASTP
jgi:hypothetical protein